MFGIGGTELFIIIAFVLMIFGPDKLPQIGRTIGQFMREFKRAQESMEAVIRAEVYAKNNNPSVSGSWDVERDDEDDEEEEEGSEEGSAASPASAVRKSPFENVAPDDDDEEEEE